MWNVEDRFCLTSSPRITKVIVIHENCANLNIPRFCKYKVAWKLTSTLIFGYWRQNIENIEKKNNFSWQYFIYHLPVVSLLGDYCLYYVDRLGSIPCLYFYAALVGIGLHWLWQKYPAKLHSGFLSAYIF